MGKKGIFLVPHQAWSYPNLLLCMDGGVSAPIPGAALENLPVSSPFGAGEPGSPRTPPLCPALPVPPAWGNPVPLTTPPAPPKKTFFACVNGAGRW